MKFSKVAFMIVSLFLIACESFLISEDPVNSPENNFQILWDEFDRWYSGFIVRNVDWDSLYTVYWPQVTPQTSDAELWDIVKAMLVNLRDPHVSVQDPRTRRSYHTANPLGLPDPLNFDLVKNKYLNNTYQRASKGRLVYGELTDEIGYLYITDFGHGDDEGLFTKVAEWTKEIDKIVSRFESFKGMIVDVRSNHGGDGLNDLRIAGAFADQKRFIYTIQTRNGPEHDDFDEPFKRYVEPMGKKQFTKPVVLLTDHESTSAAETFALLMASFPHVTHIGDSTAGGFSSVSFDRYLPNGWVYHFSHQLYKTADGRSPEGIGVVPEILIKNTEADIAAGRDRMLESAIDYLN